MDKVKISAFLLERYHIGEVTPLEKQQVEEALAKEPDLAVALANLDNSDNDFFNQYPMDFFFPDTKRLNTKDLNSKPLRAAKFPLRYRVSGKVLSICAAALVVIIALPLFILTNQGQPDFGDRMKGAAPVNSSYNSNSIELNVYVRDSSSGDVIKLSDKAGVSEGNTIQLVYSVFGVDFSEKYGVIFSIDGRSHVTIHYPYSPWQSTLLVSGRAVPLDEAFTLDDAPDYEIFFFVAGNSPIDIRNIIASARQLALQIEGRAYDAERLGNDIFKDFEVNIFTLIKE